MTEETVEQQTPFITIDDVQISIEDLPEDGKPIFGKLQRLPTAESNDSE